MKTHSHRLLTKLQVLMILGLLHLPVAAQDAQPEIRQLVIGEKTERKVFADEEAHVYALEMKRGQVLRVSFQEKGVDVGAVMLRASDPQKALAATNFGGGFMQESLTLIADEDGVYGLVVKAQRVTDKNVEAKYEFSAELKNTTTPNDIQRVKAETLLYEGSRLLEGDDKSSASLAVTKFQESMKIWNLLGEGYWAAIAKASLASAFFKLGDVAKTELYMNEVLTTFTESGNEPAIATISLSLVGLYRVTQNEKAASQHLQKAIEISRRLGDKRTESLLSSFAMLNLANETKGADFDRDLTAARAKADKLAEASLWAKRLLHYVVEEDSIPDLEQRAFLNRAEREALPLLKSIRNPDIESQIFLGLGVGFYDLTISLSLNTSEATDNANKEKSINYISRVIVLAKIQNNPVIQALAYDHLNLFYSGDNDRLAIFFGKKAISSLQNFKQDLRMFDKETQQDAAKKLDEEVYSSLASDLFYEGRLMEAHQVLNLGRDQEFFDFNINRYQEASKLSLTPRETENEQLLNSALENIAAKYSNRIDADYGLAGEELKVTLKKLEQNFDAPPSARDTVSSVADTVDMQFALRELTSKSGKKYAAIYIVEDAGEILLITPDGIFAFASSAKGNALSTNVSRFGIDQDILDFLHTLRSSSLDPRPLGARIYNEIFKTEQIVDDESKPITLEEKLKFLKPDVLLWSLSGNLRYVPVAALYDANTGQYLVEKYQNAVFTRARKERFVVEPRAWSNGVGFGTSLAYGDLSPLPDVPNEISKIFGNPATRQKGFFDGKVLLNRAFTREAMIASLRGQPAFVHIASHFIFRAGNSRNSFLLLGDGNRFSLTEMQQTPNLFAGVDLLTLSACETAAQQPGADGKEVDGFAELAQRLGASSVMATLWQIADDGTSRFMTEFYRLRQANPSAPKSEILQQAQLTLLTGKRGTISSGKTRGAEIVGVKGALTGIPFKPRAESPLEHPYYWAPFVLFGSSR